ncbi:MAG: choice-of-anchor E domain-containing protein [Planctomycetaceae bacterium]|nr:choice-of-anchor E domain-containing protein [Planctomycetaceae bacterium]
MCKLWVRLLLQGTTTLAVLIAIAGPAKADTIVQTVYYLFAPHGTSLQEYQQFNPEFGTLTAVDISVSGNFTSQTVGFMNTTFNTPSPETVSFNGSVDSTLVTDAGSQYFINSFSAQLPPYGVTSQSAGGPYDLSASYPSYPGGGFPIQWIGTGTLAPSLYGSPAVGYADDPRISIETVAFPGAMGSVISGSETITYVYTPAGAIPEPSSLVLSGMAALLLTGAWWIAR